ncbi:YciI family protein [Uliginosibacterium sp. TH139]|uniref:YciI family protein n=1 Tax=Uliginosibacterium sp. TH139 TaxID=2067453 RepID=UPI000C7C2C61|nr:YciI family protein [Uliginosibacterium sp. TH139]PLK50144.1 hypothetical protein C0V76_06990 [Uliginosibacterium sp. TH139]
MRFVAIFEDDPQMQAVRAAIEPAHLSFLEANRTEIPMAGGLKNEQDGSYVGGLWVLTVQSKARAIELIESDPYYISHPRKYRLLAWGKALPQYQVTL